MVEPFRASILQPSVLATTSCVPLVEELLPAPDPWQIFQSLAGRPHPLFLDSALLHPHLGRYSFLAADPYEWLWARGEDTHVSGEVGPRLGADPFAVLSERLALYRSESVAGLPPFQGGAAGLFSYDLCHHLERLPRAPFDEFGVPDLAIGFYDWVIAIDHQAGRAWLISTGLPESAGRRRRARARQRLREVRRCLAGGAAEERRSAPEAGAEVCLAPSYRVGEISGLRSTFDRARYLAAARRAIEYIHAGDCFQVNLAQRLVYPCVDTPVELYRRLRQRNPAPFSGYFDLGDFVVASASPERFVRVEDGEVQTRPIKGTRPRGRSSAEDQARIEELRRSAKDRAENIMIVDLMRNDLGRVCRYGSVSVPAVCRVESYPYVHHLVSEVRGQLREDRTAIDLLRAVFPGGSVTGAPKIRAMEIIAELEPVTRGAYCGSLGYIGFDGAVDTNILIRTLIIGRGWVQFPVGGGIVADSLPEREYEETWHKAQGLIEALAGTP